MEKQTKLINKKISEEQLSKELKIQVNEVQKEVAKEILQRQEEESTRAMLTNPSAPALCATKHDSGLNVNKVKKTVKQM